MRPPGASHPSFARSLRRFTICAHLRLGMFNFLNIFGHHEIDAWRDEQTLAAAAVLNDLATHLACGFEDELKSATWNDGLIAPGKFIATRVSPAVREASEPVVEKILDRANRELQEIVAHQAVWNDTPRHSTEADDPAPALQDVAVAAAPLAGGLAAAAALPAMAVTTTRLFSALRSRQLSVGRSWWSVALWQGSALQLAC